MSIEDRKRRELAAQVRQAFQEKNGRPMHLWEAQEEAGFITWLGEHHETLVRRGDLYLPGVLIGLAGEYKKAKGWPETYRLPLDFLREQYDQGLRESGEGEGWKEGH